jgi:hypothetical protein
LVHRFEAADAVRGVDFELSAHEAFVHGRPSRARGEDQLDSSCSQGAIQGRDAGVGFGSLELSDGCLADR